MKNRKKRTQFRPTKKTANAREEDAGTLRKKKKKRGGGTQPTDLFSKKREFLLPLTRKKC